MRHPATKLAVILACVLFSSPASAALYGSWPSTANITDESDAGGGGKDIQGIWYAANATNNYFRMDLYGAVISSDHANMYNIYITNTAPVPDTIPSLSSLVAMMAFDFGGNLYTASSYTPEGEKSLSVNFLMSNGDKTLEWAIPKSQLSGNFYYMGATITAPQIVNDTTSAAVVPIPNALWLLGSGVVALVGLKRRKKG